MHPRHVPYLNTPSHPNNWHGNAQTCTQDTTTTEERSRQTDPFAHDISTLVLNASILYLTGQSSTASLQMALSYTQHTPKMSHFGNILVFFLHKNEYPYILST